MRAALLSVNGVAQAQVIFETREAHVEYDPTRCRIENLIAAVANAQDPAMPVKFAATVKK